VPSVGDYVTMHCRDIDVPNANMGQYYLRYPLHPPNGVNITGVQLYVAADHRILFFAAYLTR